MPSYSHPAKPYTPTYKEPPNYAHGQASAQYIDKADDEEMKYSGFINPGSQSRSFKMLQSMTADEEANMGKAGLWLQVEISCHCRPSLLGIDQHQPKSSARITRSLRK